MPANSSAKHEPRTRVVFNLPLNDSGEERAFYEIIAHIEGLKDRNVGVTGFTHSEPMPTVFTGFWWSDEERAWVKCHRSQRPWKTDSPEI